MRSLLVVLGALIVPGLFPALVLTRSLLPAVALAPLVTALCCSGGGVLALLTRTPLLPWVVVVVVALNLAAFQAVRRRARADRGPLGSSPPRFSFHSLVPFVCVTAPLLTVRQGPFAWDARSIWWFHADWFWAGGRAVARGLANPAFQFSQPDYPPLAPATIGTLWHLRSANDLEFAQLVSAVLTVAPLVFLAVALGARFSAAVGRAVGAVVSAVAVLAVFGGTGVVATDGYVDLQWAIAFCAAAVVLLLWPVDRTYAVIGSVVLAYAALTKNEGILSSVVLLVIVAIRYRRQLRLLVFPGLAAAAGVAWIVVARVHGADSYLTSGSTFSRWMRGEFVGLDRFPPTLHAVWRTADETVLSAAVISVLGLILLRRERRRLALPSTVYLWCVALALQLLVLFAYVISPIDLQWHLDTSVDRTMLSVRVVLLAEMVVWIGVAVGSALGAARTGGSPDLLLSLDGKPTLVASMSNSARSGWGSSDRAADTSNGVAVGHREEALQKAGGDSARGPSGAPPDVDERRRRRRRG